MSAKIFYFTLQDEQTKEEKLEWFENTSFEKIPFDHITPDKKANWINLTDNDFDDFLPLMDKEVKDGKSDQAVFYLFSRGIETTRDEWVYDFSIKSLEAKIKFFIKKYNQCLLENELSQEIKWSSSLYEHFKNKIKLKFQRSKLIQISYRPYVKQNYYSEKLLSHRLTQNHYDILGTNLDGENISVWFKVGSAWDFFALSVDTLSDLLPQSGSQCLPLYRYDKNGNRIDNITDWALSQFQTHYQDPTITKDHIFHYTYAVLHHPAYRTKYEINLKREFPRLPFYANFHQWATWGKSLMDLHLNYETIEPYDLKRVDASSSSRKQKKAENATIPGLEPPLPVGEGAGGEGKPPKAKLKADKTDGKIILDTETTLEGIPALAWDYKLGNRSALEWILDQYKEKTPKDPTIRELFNTYKFADYKDHVIDLLKRVCTVSLRTMEIIHQMPDTVDHQTEK